MKELDCGQTMIISLCRCPVSRQGSLGTTQNTEQQQSPLVWLGVWCSFEVILIISNPHLRFVPH